MDQKTNIQIRIAQVADHSKIASIYNEYIALGNATMEEVLHTESDITAWTKKFHDRERLYVMVDKEAVIGWGIIKRYSDRKGYRYACETAIYLTSTERGKGYGTMLKKFLIEDCKSMEYRHLVAKIFAINEASINYNLKLGYTIVGRQNQIGFRNEKWQDIVIMQYLIK